MKSSKSITRGGLSILAVVVFILAACSNTLALTPPATSAPLVATLTQTPFDNTPTPEPMPPTSSPTQATMVSPTPRSTIDVTQQTWQATAIAIATTAQAASNSTQNAKAMEIARFSVACDDMNFYSSAISPDGHWLAASCGYERNQMLIVRNQSGTTWTLKFQDFLSAANPDGMTGALYPEFWSPDGAYLFFVTTLGYSGGGNDCFPGFGVYGLFRLNLSTGTWTTLIPPTDLFPGYEITFAPTGRRYAVDLNGILIADLQSGEVTQIDDPDVMDLSWSPDGHQLAYSVARCYDDIVQTSAVYIWDALTEQTQLVLATDGRIILRPESWTDSLTLRISENIGLVLCHSCFAG